MADVTVSYNGSDIVELSDSGTKTLKTDGKVCADDIEIAYVKPSGGDVTVEALSATENKTYTAPTGKAYSPVTVAVPQKTEDALSVNTNGTYTPSEGHVYNSVSVAVPTKADELKGLIERTLTSFSVPSNVTVIGPGAFSSCSSLASITIPEGVMQIDGAFSGTAISSIVVPNSCTKLGPSAFYGLSNLLELTIGAGVNSFGYGACRNLTNLTKLTFKATSPPPVSGSTVFQGLNTACVVHVPYSADHSVLAAYKAGTNMPDPSIYTYVEDAA